jgi:predicted transposase YdaD
LPSDHWYAEVFRALPDLVRQLLPGLAATGAGATNTDAATAYTFRPITLKKVAHHPDGVLWPRQHPGGSTGFPVVLLEVQMHADRHFHRRLAAETFRLLQQHEEVEHLQVLVLLAHRGLALGSSQPLLLRRFLQQDVTWVDLAALARQPDLDPSLALLTLPVQKEQDLGPCTERILALRPDLIELILPILSERFQGLSNQQIMATLGISKDFWRHTRAFQDILEEGRQEGREEGAALGRQEGVELGRQEGVALGRQVGLEQGLEEGRRREACDLALRLLERRCGSLEAATSARIEALFLPQLEELALALLDFQGAEDLRSWLEQLES